jgi:hypothetical protein
MSSRLILARTAVIVAGGLALFDIGCQRTAVGNRDDGGPLGDASVDGGGSGAGGAAPGPGSGGTGFGGGGGDAAGRGGGGAAGSDDPSTSSGGASGNDGGLDAGAVLDGAPESRDGTTDGCRGEAQSPGASPGFPGPKCTSTTGSCSPGDSCHTEMFCCSEFYAIDFLSCDCSGRWRTVLVNDPLACFGPCVQPGQGGAGGTGMGGGGGVQGVGGAGGKGVGGAGG